MQAFWIQWKRLFKCVLLELGVELWTSHSRVECSTAESFLPQTFLVCWNCRHYGLASLNQSQLYKPQAVLLGTDTISLFLHTPTDSQVWCPHDLEVLLHPWVLPYQYAGHSTRVSTGYPSPPLSLWWGVPCVLHLIHLTNCSLASYVGQPYWTTVFLTIDTISLFFHKTRAWTLYWPIWRPGHKPDSDQYVCHKTRALTV